MQNIYCIGGIVRHKNVKTVKKKGKSEPKKLSHRLEQKRTIYYSLP